MFLPPPRNIRHRLQAIDLAIERLTTGSPIPERDSPMPSLEDILAHHPAIPLIGQGYRSKMRAEDCDMARERLYPVRL